MNHIARQLMAAIALGLVSAGTLASSEKSSKTTIDIDQRSSCLFESKAYSIGSKILFTYTRPVSALIVQETAECQRPDQEKKDTAAYWKTFSISCKNPITNKGESCM